MENPGYLLGNPVHIVVLITWAAIWITGGIWLVSAAFRLTTHERFMVGFGVGWITQTIIANLLANLLPLTLASWLGAVLVLLLGAGFIYAMDWRNLTRIPFPVGQIITFFILGFIFTVMARGLGLFDDYAHMPTLSIMATGEVPPRFALNPEVSYGYHYLLMFSSAEMMQIGNLLPWTALDLARGISVALSILLTYLWIQRLTGNKVAGGLGAVFGLFATGTRWLLLFLPEQTIHRISQRVHLIGSGASSGANLAEALTSSWGIDGLGKFPIPFAYANGITLPGFLSIGDVNGAIASVVSILLLLTFNRWNGWKGAVTSGLLISAIALVSEVSVVLGFAAWLMITLAVVLHSRRFHLPSSLKQWWLVLLGGNLFGMLQGGAIADLLTGWLSNSRAPAESYQTVGFQIMHTPSVVSSHLGVLWLNNPNTLLVAAAEIGPILLALPLVVIFGWKAWRAGRWYEAAMVASGIISLSMLMVQFTGSTGVRNTSRLYSFISTCYLFGFPLIWIWVRQRKAVIQSLAVNLALIVTLSGFVSFSAALTAAPKPVYAPFINDLDLQIMQQVWNRLEPGALVFDPDPYRGPTVTGRYINAHRTWFESKPEYQKLQKKPLLADLCSAGYAYAYFDDESWRGWDFETQQSLSAPCIVITASAESPLGFRRLIDLRGCSEPEKMRE